MAVKIVDRKLARNKNCRINFLLLSFKGSNLTFTVSVNLLKFGSGIIALIINQRFLMKHQQKGKKVTLQLLFILKFALRLRHP